LAGSKVWSSKSLVIKEIPRPEPKAGHVLIAVKAFGVNHAETHMRKGEWAEAAEVSGIECVGEVVAAPGGEFQSGDKVAAFMGEWVGQSMGAMQNTLSYRRPT
jgi:NADPH:quinone reductase